MKKASKSQDTPQTDKCSSSFYQSDYRIRVTKVLCCWQKNKNIRKYNETEPSNAHAMIFERLQYRGVCTGDQLTKRRTIQYVIYVYRKE